MHGSMQNVEPVINQAHRGGMLRLAFLSAVVSLVVSFAAAAPRRCFSAAARMVWTRLGWGCSRRPLRAPPRLMRPLKSAVVAAAPTNRHSQTFVH
jgi:hypothetical protein